MSPKPVVLRGFVFEPWPSGSVYFARFVLGNLSGEALDMQLGSEQVASNQLLGGLIRETMWCFVMCFGRQTLLL